MPPTIRPATESDTAALTEFDATFVAGRRVLALMRTGSPPELNFSFEWRQGTPAETTYTEFTPEGVRRALKKADLFLVAEVDGQIAGVLMILLPEYTDAGEITDLVADRRFRRRGAGRALVLAAVDWARERNLRALWVEPRAGYDEAIEFYLSLGFRLSGFSDRLYSNSDHEDGRPTLYMHLELEGGPA
jgi:ribosomal protein S18 acetylase RimI-like enzyme